MDNLSDIGRALPYYALLPLLLVGAIITFALWRRTHSVAMRFVMIAIEFRIMCAALHEVTFLRSPLGLSYNALTSIAISVTGLLVVRQRSLFGAALPPYYIYIGMLLASGLATAHWPGTISDITKFIYLIVLMLAVQDAIEDVGFDRFLRMLIPIFALPFMLQAASIVLGVAKAGENDGSASYIGGFYHEAAFSVALSAPLLVVCLQRRLGLFSKIVLVLICAVGIFLANYRTVILAMTPLVGFAVLLDAPRHFKAGQRAVIGGFMALLVAAAAIGGGIAAEDRFADLGFVATEGTRLIKRPEFFSTDERHVMSGRAMIWSGYLYGWQDGTPKQKLLGHGPDSWSENFKLYAHNTLVSALFELGVLGVIVTIILWLWMLVLAVLSQGGPKTEIVVAHLCFFILNMATMPMWMIEGMIFYGLLCGVTLHFYYQSRLKSRARRPRLRFVMA